MLSDEASVRSWYDQVQKPLSSSSVSCNIMVSPTLFSLPTVLLYFTGDPLGYIGEFEDVNDHHSSKIVIQLNGQLNKTGVVMMSK